MAQVGRPASDNPRTNAIPVRFTSGEIAQVRAAADRAGQKVGVWLREKAIAAAKRSA